MRFTAIAEVMLAVLPYSARARAKQFQVPSAEGNARTACHRKGWLAASQKNGEFENAGAMMPPALLDFLNKWKPEAR